MKAESKMSERPGKMKLQDGFTILELLTSIAIISILVAVAVPQFSKSKTRAYDMNTESTLRTVFQACKDYWIFNSSYDSCLLTTVSNNEYGFIPSDTVEVTIDSDDNNTEDDFYATARHTSSSNIYAINHQGTVSKLTVDGEDGDNGHGCSEEAHDDPHDLGENSKGGCA
jgi:prepilin-type N-terminal cleavage/methylation domain-containing protein